MPESRKRKPKKKPARPGRPFVTPLPPLGGTQVLDDYAAARALRPSCNDCGSTDLAWCRLADAPESARLPSQRAAATGFLVVQGLDGGTQFWACGNCDNCGAFGPMGDPDRALAPWGF